MHAMTTRRFSAAAFTFVAAACAYIDETKAGDRGAASNPQSKSAQALDVRVTSSKPRYDVLEPVVITVEIRNQPGRQETIIINKPLYQRFRVSVYDKNGREVSQTTYGRRMAHHGFSLDRTAGDTVRVSGKLAVNLLRDMTQPGKYTVVVSVPYGEIRSVDELKDAKYASSSPIEIEIGDLPKVDD